MHFKNAKRFKLLLGENFSQAIFCLRNFAQDYIEQFHRVTLSKSNVFKFAIL